MNYTLLCPVCRKPIQEVRAIIFKCPEHDEFTVPEINRAMGEYVKIEPEEKPKRKHAPKDQDSGLF